MTTTKKRNLLFYIPLAALVVISGYLSFRNWQKDKIIKAQNIELTKWSSEIRTYTDTKGNNHTQVQQQNMSTKESVAALGEKVAKVIGVKDKQIQEVTDVNSQIKGEIKAKAEVISAVKAENNQVKAENKVLRDSLYRIKYADKFLDFSGELNADSKEFLGKYSYSDSLRFVRFIDKSFSREKTFVDVYSNNPNRQVTGLRSIKIGDDRIKRFGIGPALGYMFNPESAKFEISGGVVLSYDLIRF